jgi:Uma2 family endonuclease
MLRILGACFVPRTRGEVSVAMSTPAKEWTLEELHSLPDDGNTYELVRGELFVTPPPAVSHEQIVARLTRILVPFVAAHDIGDVYYPRAVVQFQGSQVEPDLMVRPPHPDPDGGWAAWPAPFLVIEIISPSTRRRDHEQKKSLYLSAGVAEYWIVDPEERTVRVVRPGEADRVERSRVEWRPPGADVVLSVSVDDVLGATESG